MFACGSNTGSLAIETVMIIQVIQQQIGDFGPAGPSECFTRG